MRPANVVNLKARNTELRPASNIHSFSLNNPLELCTGWLKLPLVCAASSSVFRALLTLQLVLDGGTGFLKAGYAGQVCGIQSARRDMAKANMLLFRTSPTTSFPQ
jgi:hypothetical protein